LRLEPSAKITVPRVPISFGNSYMGVLDLARARQVTMALFAAYGVVLKPNHPIARRGIEFHADGYDPERLVGLEIVHFGPPARGFQAPDPDPAASAGPSATFRGRVCGDEGRDRPA